jgi:hypothetical protein
LASLISPRSAGNLRGNAGVINRYLHPNRSKEMKTLMSMFALAVALAFAGPAFAGDVTAATTQADCEKAGGQWDANTSKCSEKKS